MGARCRTYPRGSTLRTVGNPLSCDSGRTSRLRRSNSVSCGSSRRSAHTRRVHEPRSAALDTTNAGSFTGGGSGPEKQPDDGSALPNARHPASGWHHRQTIPSTSSRVYAARLQLLPRGRGLRATPSRLRNAGSLIAADPSCSRCRQTVRPSGPKPLVTLLVSLYFRRLGLGCCYWLSYRDSLRYFSWPDDRDGSGYGDAWIFTIRLR